MLKKILLLIAAALVLEAYQDNFPTIRVAGDVTVRKFEDGSNTCYTAYTPQSETVNDYD